jgi:site-specific DNA-methyltransferase (adenine-specific)
LQQLEPFVNQVTHGDCTEILQTLPSQSVDFIAADPPYLVRYRPRDGRRCPNDDNASWLNPAFRELFRVLKPNKFCACFYGWPWIDRFMAAWRTSGFRPVSHLVWVKNHCSRRGYTESYHEVGFLLAKGKPAIPASAPRDVLPWEYTGNKLHPNQKPVIAITPLIEAYSNPGDIVLDPFAGSGTAGVAAQICGRRFILIERDEHMCRVARDRLGSQSGFAGQWNAVRASSE